MQAALRSSAAALRSSFLLQQLRVGVAPSGRPAFTVPALFTSGLSTQGGYLDKSVVTDRVLEIVKKMDKVDPAKVGRISAPGFGALLFFVSRMCAVFSVDWWRV